MGAINRVATEMNAGAATTTTGLTAEVVKHVDEIPPVDIMLIDWIFWTDDFTLTTGGVIAFFGFFMLMHGAYRGHRERKKREERETFPDSVVRDPDE